MQNRSNNNSSSGSSSVSSGRGIEPGRDTRVCNFCREIGHFMLECPEVDKYLKEGKIRKMLEGRIQLSNGIYCSKSIPGLWLKECVDEWHCQNPNQLIKDVAAAAVVAGGVAANFMYR
jgi:hypothetical protein